MAATAEHAQRCNLTESNELINQLIIGNKKSDTFICENGELKQLTTRMGDFALEADMTE